MNSYLLNYLTKYNLDIKEVISDLVKITKEAEKKNNTEQSKIDFITQKINDNVNISKEDYHNFLNSTKSFFKSYEEEKKEEKFIAMFPEKDEYTSKEIFQILCNITNKFKEIANMRKDESSEIYNKDESSEIYNNLVEYFFEYQIFFQDQNISMKNKKLKDIKQKYSNENWLKITNIFRGTIKNNFKKLKENLSNYFLNPKILIGKQIGIWRNSNYELSDIFNDFNEQNQNKYFNEIIFNFLLEKTDKNNFIKMYNPIYLILNDLNNGNKILEIDKEINIDDLLKNLNLNNNQQNAFKSFVGIFLKNLNWLDYQQNENKLIIKKNSNVNQLKKKCNSPYENKFLKEYEIIKLNLTNLSCYLGTQIKQISHQKIYFGSPGTGKSYRVNQDLKEIYPEKIIRITFHPSYYYSDFVAVYKPTYNGKNTNFDIVSGPLIDILIEALLNKSKNYLLIIDEINRANVSEVFGDFFQLIERNKEGMSEYKINVKKDLWNHLKKKLNSLLLDNFEGLYFPPNLYIWATMNSSDQGTFPLDTAFKRRWNFEYIGIDDNEKEVENICFKLPSDNKKIKWNEFRKLINEKLLKINNTINEDKLLGPFFIGGNLNKDDLEGNGEIIKNKVIPYLYEDVLKFLGTEAISAIFTSNKDSKKEEENVILTLSDIIKKFEKEEIKNIFNFDEKEIKKIEEKK